MYGPWQYGHMSLNQYRVKHNAIVAAMRAVDPGVKVTLSGASVCEKGIGAAEKKGNFFPSMWEPPIPDTLPFAFGSTADCDYWLLNNCTANVDYLSEHTYAYPELRFDAAAQKFVDADDPLPTRARRLANRIGGAFDCFGTSTWRWFRSLRTATSSSSLTNGAAPPPSAGGNNAGGGRAAPRCSCLFRTPSASTRCSGTPTWSRRAVRRAACAC